jgi:hypothetical protein
MAYTPLIEGHHRSFSSIILTASDNIVLTRILEKHNDSKPILIDRNSLFMERNLWPLAWTMDLVHKTVGIASQSL